MNIELSSTPFAPFHYHYNCDKFNDAGWGCVYRNMQTIFSYINAFIILIEIPKLSEILTWFNKPFNGKGTKMWIEPHQAKSFMYNYFYEKFNKKYFNFTEILWVKDNNSIEHIEYTPLEIYTKSPNILLCGFESIAELIDILRINLNNKIPILIDNGTYSYLVKSIDSNNNGIIIDPHCKESARILQRDLSKWLINSNCWMILLIKD
jgi:hypothetical protein